MQTVAGISGFRPKYYLDGRSCTSNIVRFVIGNSQTLKVGSRVKWVAASGVHPADAAADKTFGYVVGFATRDGKPLYSAVSGTDYDGTYTEAIDGDTYAAAADNETDKKVVALIAPAEGLVVSAKLDAAPATTTGSDKPGYYLDIETTAGNRAALLDESTAGTSVANFVTMPVPGSETTAKDPEANASGDNRVYVMAAELQVVGDGVAQSA